MKALSLRAAEQQQVQTKTNLYRLMKRGRSGSWKFVPVEEELQLDGMVEALTLTLPPILQEELWMLPVRQLVICC